MLDNHRCQFEDWSPLKAHNIGFYRKYYVSGLYINDGANASGVLLIY